MHFDQEAESGGKIFSGMAEAHSSLTIKVKEACFAAGDRATPLFTAEVSKSSAPLGSIFSDSSLKFWKPHKLQYANHLLKK
jgi:hypothetical protein